MSVSIEQNHELHGAMMGVVTAVVMKVSGQTLSDSLTAGSMVGVVATAAMKTFGHPNFLIDMIKKK